MARMATNITAECDSALLRRKSKTTTAQWISRRTAIIASSWFIITIPITALTVALLVMVFRYRLNHGNYPFENLRLPSAENESHILHVNLNSGIILFVASWTSSVAPLLSGFTLSLASFPIARRMFYDFQGGDVDRLPSPYQLALTLKFIDGSTLGGIWNWILYLLSWRNSRQPQAPPLVAVSTIAVLATILGLLVSVADAWLHLTTSTAPFTHVSPTSITPDYSFGLVPECLKSNNSAVAQFPWDNQPPCTITYRGLKNSTVSFQVLSNISADATVYTYTNLHGKPFTYLGVPEHEALFRRDFTARTYGANTQCQLISEECNLRIDGFRNAYNCSAAFNGFLTGSSDLRTVFFDGKNMTEELLSQNYGAGNPYYFAMASGEYVDKSVVPNSTGFLGALHGGQTYVLGCNTTIYDIEYDRLNNTITRFVPSISNTSVSNIWQTSVSDNRFWVHNMKQATQTAIFGATSQGFANKVALAFSKMTLAMGAQGVEQRPVLAIQERETVLAARIPKAPLATLVAFSLLYVLCGLVLTALALWAAGHKIQDLQAALSIAGLVADRFEEPSSQCTSDSVEGMFEKYFGNTDKRVGIDSLDEDRTFRYVTRRKAHGPSLMSEL